MKEREIKRAEISQIINLGNGKFKDCELDELLKIAKNAQSFDGKRKYYSKTEDVDDVQGRWTSITDTVYIGHLKNGKLSVEKCTHTNNDGNEFDDITIIDTARGLLNILGKFLR